MFKQEQTSECLSCGVQLTNIYEIHYHNQSFTCLNAIFYLHLNAYTVKRLDFSVGNIVDTSLLSNPLFGCGTMLDSLQSIEHLASFLSPLLSQTLTTNPFFLNICYSF
jgi:hypothetical protein